MRVAVECICILFLIVGSLADLDVEGPDGHSHDKKSRVKRAGGRRMGISAAPGQSLLSSAEIKSLQNGGALNAASGWMQKATTGAMITSSVMAVTQLGMSIASLVEAKEARKIQQENFDKQMALQVYSLCDQICVTDWSPWGTCLGGTPAVPAICGFGGTTKRTRTLFEDKTGHCKDHDCRHKNNLSQQTACNVGCPNSGIPQAINKCQCPAQFGGDCCQSEISCDYPGKPQFGKTEGSFPSEYGQIAQYSCDEGYAMTGNDDTAICNEKGWSVKKPDCKKITCSEPKTPSNGELLNRASVYNFGDQVVYICNDGYELKGMDRMKCSSVAGMGTWAGFPPLCRPVNCGPPGYPLDGFVNGTDFTLGAKAEFTCDTGFRLVGHQVRHCLTTGQWSGQEPTCEMIECEEPYVPEYGSILRTYKVYRFGLAVTYTCDTGYVMDGSSKATCKQDPLGGRFGPGGLWSNEPPLCKPAVCGDPGDVANGAKDGLVFYFPNNITFSCFPGFTMSGANKLHCQSTGTWDHPIPTCTACPLMHYREEASTQDGDKCDLCPPNSNTTSVGSHSKQLCHCDHGYKGPAGGPCQLIVCPELSAPEHGTMEPCERTFASECTFACDPGFIMERGRSVRTCENTEEWSGFEPVCFPCPKDLFKLTERSCAQCPVNAHTENEASVLTDCICNEGYVGEPGGECSDIDECLDNDGKGPCSDVCKNHPGSFQCDCSIVGYIVDPSDPLKCFANNTCRNLTSEDAPSHGGLLCHWFNEFNAQQCAVRCDKQYEFPTSRNNFETCGSSTGFKWSFENADKQIEDCIEEYFPDYIAEIESAYFVRACKDLTEDEQRQVKEQFAEVLNENAVCKSRLNQPVCQVKDMGIICGKSRRRRRRDTGELEVVDEVDFRFDLGAFKKLTDHTDCPVVCDLLRIRADRCQDICFESYRRYMKAALDYNSRVVTKIFQERPQDLSFNAAHRLFEAHTLIRSETTINCDPGMRMGADKTNCVPCQAGTHVSVNGTSCDPCELGFYQAEARQDHCDPCPDGFFTKSEGSTKCTACEEGRYGFKCTGVCQECGNGICHPETGECVCNAGWEGPTCEVDTQACLAHSCYPGVTCKDMPAPNTGFQCGECPDGMEGDGDTCRPIPEPHRRNINELVWLMNYNN